MMRFDHVAIACATLADGVNWVEQTLGVPLQTGGQHPAFGTHNALLSLGPDEYLEVIAIDPTADAPNRARWFDLDHFDGAPRLTNWIVQVDDMTGLPADVGAPMPLARGDLRWRMAVPDDGKLPFDNLHPAMICWDGPHAAARLPDHGVRLRTLTVTHPRATELRARLSVNDPRIDIVQGASALSASFDTPNGVRSL